MAEKFRKFRNFEMWHQHTETEHLKQQFQFNIAIEVAFVLWYTFQYHHEYFISHRLCNSWNQYHDSNHWKLDQGTFIRTPELASAQNNEVIWNLNKLVCESQCIPKTKTQQILRLE